MTSQPEAAIAALVQPRFLQVRRRSESLAEPLSPEDAQVQSMPDASPAKWHLAHTTWFFETFILREREPNFRAHDPSYHFLFNSYYEAEGARHPRPQRGLLTRPSLAAVIAYRHAVTERILTLIEGTRSRDTWLELTALLELGCQHEEQHQELLLTDIKHAFSLNPLGPAYADGVPHPATNQAPPLHFASFAAGLYEIGHDGIGFAFDNEAPRHPRHVGPFALATRLVTNGEYRAFIEEGGYDDPRHWLAQGWDWVLAEGRTAPLYWQRRDDTWWTHTLHGQRPVEADEPVLHVSLYEADAYATWAGARLPREEELEIARATTPASDAVNDLGSGRLHPTVAAAGATPDSITQLEGDAWEWTQSAYSAYPGFARATGAIGEYNGKFMCGQFVLKGGSCLTPPRHARPSYRNFFPPAAQWQATGIRLAKDG